MLIPSIVIEKKSDGHALTKEEIEFIVNGYTEGNIPDYQMSAWLMAVCHVGMNADEISWLTQIMQNSGETISHSTITKPIVDKHSTGGVGDKVSIILGPLMAACGIAVPMISGRGLGTCGGTLDKLESIPGYRCNLTEQEFKDIVADCGCAISGQTSDLAPADKKIYALRDVTATVRSIPLITASILSKKFAAGIDKLVMDVKHGEGAYMRKLDEALALAHSLHDVCDGVGKQMVAVVTDMNSPLGNAIGHSLEVVESIECLQGNGPADLMEVTFVLGQHMLLMAGLATNAESAQALMDAAITNGSALSKFIDIIERQGGDTRYISDTSHFAQAAIIKPVIARDSGFIKRIGALGVAKAVVALGGARVEITDDIDLAVGIKLAKKVGEPVSKGETIAYIHGQTDEKIAEAEALMVAEIEYSADAVERPSRITEVVGG